eukprot:2070021-Prymnesium_polylepis.1
MLQQTKEGLFEERLKVADERRRQAADDATIVAEMRAVRAPIVARVRTCRVCRRRALVPRPPATLRPPVTLRPLATLRPPARHAAPARHAPPARHAARARHAVLCRAPPAETSCGATPRKSASSPDAPLA